MDKLDILFISEFIEFSLILNVFYINFRFLVLIFFLCVDLIVLESFFCSLILCLLKNNEFCNKLYLFDLIFIFNNSLFLIFLLYFLLYFFSVLIIFNF